MRKLFFLAMLLPFSLSAQLNISFLGQVDYNALHSTGLSNLWGYADEFGNEYAIVGTQDGISIVDVTTPTAPVEIFFLPGSNTIWREVKTYNNYAYISTESTDGLVIINLNPLPGTVSTTTDVTYFFGAVGNTFSTAHSLFIDENGILFLHGTDVGNGGVILYDLNTSATNPAEVGMFDDYYVHDSYARGDTLYSAHINDGFFSITDVSNPASITYMAGVQNTPMNFTHNCWLSADGKYLFTTDEVSAAWIGAYDISDFSDIKEVDRIRRSETSGSIPHNTYWLNNYIVTSYYRDGVTIHDVTDPSNMIEVGHYDTSPLSGDGFNGAWGVYPFLPSGNLLISDMEEGLFILGPMYVRACYIDGTVTDASTSANLNNVQVDILTTANFDQSDLTGFYSSGVATAGSYDVVYSKAGYISDTVTVNFVSATTVTVDVALQPLPTFAFTGTITTGGGATPLDGATVLVENGSYSYTTTTNSAGNFTIMPFAIDTTDDVFNITVGLWGYQTYCVSGVVIDGTNPPFTADLNQGYYDDFAMDFGWTVNSTASAGFWVREEPYGTLSGGEFSNPEVDVTGDCFDKAYVTGNENNPSVGNDDVDGGYTHLISPVFNTSGLTDPYVTFYLWFRNTGGFSTPNDSVMIYIHDGTLKQMDTKHLGNFAEHNWIQVAYQLSDFTTATSGLTLQVRAEDVGAGHLLEAGVDLFQVVEGNPLNTPESASLTSVEVLVFPNPAQNELNIRSLIALKQIEVFDLSGKRILVQAGNNNNLITLNCTALENGVYSLRMLDVNGKWYNQKMVKQ